MNNAEPDNKQNNMAYIYDFYCTPYIECKDK